MAFSIELPTVLALAGAVNLDRKKHQRPRLCLGFELYTRHRSLTTVPLSRSHRTTRFPASVRRS